MLNSIEFWSMIISSLIAIIALVQSAHANWFSKKANRTAEEANVLSQRAMEESEKEFFPIVKIVDEISVLEKDYVTLCNEVSFDFINDLINYDEHYDEKITCICFSLKNIGNGLLTGIAMEGILIQEGNLWTLDGRFQGDKDVLCIFDECNIEQETTLCPGETLKVNLLIDNSDYEKEEYQERIKKFFDNNNNITVGIKLRLTSINKSSYKQDWLFGVFLNKNICLNSFGNAEKIKNVK